MLRKLLSPNQAAAYLGVTPTTLDRWRQARSGPKWLYALKDGRPHPLRAAQQPDAPPPAFGGKVTIRYAVEDLDAWIEASTIDPAAVPKRASRRSVRPRPLTDLQFARVVEALLDAHARGVVHANAVRDLPRVRRMLDCLMMALGLGEWKEAEQVCGLGYEQGRHWAKLWADRGWLDVVFDALRDDATFGATLVHQTVVVARQTRDAGSGNLHGDLPALRVAGRAVGPSESLIPHMAAPRTVAAEEIAGRARRR